MKLVHIKGDINLYSNNNLSILLTQGGLSYSAFDISDNKYQVLTSMQFINPTNKTAEISEFLNNEELKDINFANTNIVYASKKVTIVPEALFDENNASLIFETSQKLNENEHLCWTHLPKSSLVTIFAVEKRILDFFDKHFSSYQIDTQASAFIEVNLRKTKISEEPKRQRMFVNVFEDFFELLVIKNGEIICYNTYNYKSPNDILYFIINTFEQLGLSQTDCEVAFSGFIEQDSIAIVYLKKFVSIVYFEALNREYKYFYRFLEFAPHYFYNFLNVNR